LSAAIIMARVYADVNEHMPRSYWDYDSVNISWGVLENYEVVRKIGKANRYLSAVTYRPPNIAAVGWGRSVRDDQY
jgi:hypothetical protein